MALIIGYWLEMHELGIQDAEDLYLCCKEALVLVDNGFLFRILDRTWSPFPNGFYRLVCRNFLSYEITGKNGACTTKPSDAVNCNRHFSVQAKVNYGKSLFNLVKSRSRKVNNGDMFNENTNFPESLSGERLFSKVDHGSNPQLPQECKGIFRLWIRQSSKFLFHEPAKMGKDNLRLLFFSEIISLQEPQWTLQELLTKGLLKVRSYFDLA